MFLKLSKNMMALALIGLLPACSKIDDYMLGKDNTPQPSELKPVKAKVAMIEKWNAPVGGSRKNETYLRLRPTVAGNVLYSADHSGYVQAIDKSTGAQQWAKKVPYALVSGPAVGDGSLILASDDSSIIALKQQDGSELWKAKVSGEVLAKPIISHGKVIAKTIDGNLYAFDVHSGEKKWVSVHGAPNLILKASSSPVVMGNVVVVGYSDGKMDAVDLESGHLLWQKSLVYATGSSDVERLVDIDADPIIRGNVAILGSYQGYIGAISLTDGQFLWSKPVSLYKNMVVRGGSLYLTDSNDVIWAINTRNGQVNWKQVALKARGLTEPVLMGDRLFVGDKTGMMHVLSTQSGEFLARAPMNGAVSVAPLALGNNLYVMTSNGKLSRYTVS
ncbi:outer membrane protein assembly factor BamB [Legionella erythra]|uniref:Outer membrane protein assembly factor BamB n=1 Tax=Legionella erythra TaxID=448 RepID=A0A0W0TQZ0_LEGER|nr:outer membrane protein assembly factor BamB [Legionella erythra]KTC98033.1 PQQ (pyrrolo-quinoline quinone) enzyme repeat protein [Legionella erythra]